MILMTCLTAVVLLSILLWIQILKRKKTKSTIYWLKSNIKFLVFFSFLTSFIQSGMNTLVMYIICLHISWLMLRFDHAITVVETFIYTIAKACTVTEPSDKFHQVCLNLQPIFHEENSRNQLPSKLDQLSKKRIYSC